MDVAAAWIGVVIVVFWRKPPRATRETAGARIHQFIKMHMCAKAQKHVCANMSGSSLKLIIFELGRCDFSSKLSWFQPAHDGIMIIYLKYNNVSTGKPGT